MLHNRRRRAPPVISHVEVHRRPPGGASSEASVPAITRAEVEAIVRELFTGSLALAELFKHNFSELVFIAGAGLEKVGNELKIKPKSIVTAMLALKVIGNEQLNGECVEFGGPANNVKVTTQTITNPMMAEESITGFNVVLEAITNALIASKTIVASEKIKELSITGGLIARNTLGGTLASTPPVAKCAAEGAASAAVAAGSTSIVQGQVFYITGNGAQTTWKCKHTMGLTAGGTRFVAGGVVWKLNAAEEPVETLATTVKSVISSGTEVEAILSAAPAKGEKVAFSLRTF